MSHQVQLTDQSFAEFVRLNRFVLIHFWATWNRHDDQQRAMIDTELPEDLVKQVAFGTMEVDPVEHHAICVQHRICNIPFFAFYRAGLLVRTKTGAQSAIILVKELRDLIDESS